MTKPKNIPPENQNEMRFGEALARSVQIDPKELAETHERIKRSEEDADRFIKDRIQSITRGARRAPKRFRL